LTTKRGDVKSLEGAERTDCRSESISYADPFKGTLKSKEEFARERWEIAAKSSWRVWQEEGRGRRVRLQSGKGELNFERKTPVSEKVVG